MKGVWLVVASCIGFAVACLPAASPDPPTCAKGSCCYVGSTIFDLDARRPRVLMQKAPDTTTVTSNIPCGSNGVYCGGDMCCGQGYVCGPTN